MIKFNQTKLTKTNTQTINNKYMNSKNNIKTLINNLKHQAEYYVSDTHYYRPITEGLNVTEKKPAYKGIAFTITQDESNQASHILEVSLLHPSMVKEIKRPLAMGNKNEILEYLNNEKSMETINQNIKEMAQKLSNV